MTHVPEDSKEILPLDALGTTGLKHHSGIIDEEFMHRLRGRNAQLLYREMIKNSPSIAAAMNAIRMLIKQVEWRVEPADESDAALAEAEDTESALEDMSHTWDELISEILSMIWAGYAPFEIIYKIRRGPDQEQGKFRSKFSDGKFGWRKIELRAQETVDRWVFDDEGGLDGLVQMDIYQGVQEGSGPVFIPIEKMLLFRMNSFKNNPEGESLIRPAVIPYWFTKRIQEFEAIGIERNLAGMPIMEVPAEIMSPNASSGHRALRSQLEKFITQVRMDERWGGLVPSETTREGLSSGFKFKLMQSSGRKLVDTDVIIKRYRSEMLMLFMAQFLTMGTESVGSYSLSSNMTNLFGTALGSIMGSIADVINRFLIPRRQELNGIDPALSPIIVHGDIEGPELDKLGAYIQQLATAGMISPNDALERKLMEIGNLPQPPKEGDTPNGLDDQTIDSVDRNAFNADSVRVILDVNSALKNNTLDRGAAIATLMAVLNITDEKAQTFIPKESDEPKQQPPPGNTEPVARLPPDESSEDGNVRGDDGE